MNLRNILSALAAVLLIILPLFSQSAADSAVASREALLAPLADSLTRRPATVLLLRGPKARTGLVSVDAAWSGCPSVTLRPTQTSAAWRGDTLIIDLDDPSDIFQGTIRLPGMRKAIFAASADTMLFAPSPLPFTTRHVSPVRYRR